GPLPALPGRGLLAFRRCSRTRTAVITIPARSARREHHRHRALDPLAPAYSRGGFPLLPPAVFARPFTPLSGCPGRATGGLRAEEQKPLPGRRKGFLKEDVLREGSAEGCGAGLDDAEEAGQEDHGPDAVHVRQARADGRADPRLHLRRGTLGDELAE